MNSETVDVEIADVNDYAGGIAYGAGGLGAFPSVPTYDVLFDLTGDQTTGAPEPGTVALVAGAVALLAVFRRRGAAREALPR